MTLFGRVIIGVASLIIGAVVLLAVWLFSDFGAGLRFGIYTAIGVFFISNLIILWMEDGTILDNDYLHEEGKIEADRRDMQKMIDRGDIRK